MECPIVARKFTVWGLPPRLAQPGYQHDWRFGARWGNDADGSWAQEVTLLASTPTGAREATIRQVMGVPRARGQAGYPPSISGLPAR